MNQTYATLELNKDQIAFLQKDYELKIAHLSNHFTRTWTRFNFFLVVQSGISVALWVWLKDRGGFSAQSPALAWVGFFSALVWYAFGAQHRYLVEVYRQQVEAAGKIIAGKLGLRDYTFVGDESIRLNQKWYESLYQWKSTLFSPTRLAAWFPLLAIVYWIYMILLTSTTAPPPVAR